jgi:hypothetical protein
MYIIYKLNLREIAHAYTIHILRMYTCIDMGYICSECLITKPKEKGTLSYGIFTCHTCRIKVYYIKLYYIILYYIILYYIILYYIILYYIVLYLLCYIYLCSHI